MVGTFQKKFCKQHPAGGKYGWETRDIAYMDLTAAGTNEQLLRIEEKVL